jgi:cobalt-zinc-cadmium efflux system protein
VPAHAGHHHPGHAGHDHGHDRVFAGDLRWFIGIALNLGFVAVEAVFGLIGRSTALLADAGHNLSDVLGLGMAAVAAWLAARPADPRRTYGWGKATVLAALANAVILVFVSGLIASEAVRRFASASMPATGIMMGVAAAGVLVNGSSALLFLRGRREDANVRGAFLHLAGDAAVSAGVIVAGGLIYLTGKAWIDPLASLIVVGVVLVGTWSLLKEAFHLAVDAAPMGLDPVAIRALLASRPGVSAVHDLHIWAMSTTEVALTAHLVRPTGADDAFLHEACEALRREFGIAHATLQVETDGFDACAKLHG